MTQISDEAIQSKDVPVIAIGASAGGLEPLEHFFEAAPKHAGWCYVVIQHLSPDYRSMMDELLGRRSRLRILHIEDGLQIEPDTIYLNRPNRLVELDHDRFRTRAYSDNDDLPRLTIDGFFSSLTKRDPKSTIAVVLSGSGSDGTRGAHALRDRGAAVIAQSPSEAAFSSMPLSAISAGAVDRVLPAAEIPAAIGQILSGERSPSTAGPSNNGTGTHPTGILRLLEERYRIDFSSYKAANVQRRIERRQHLRGIATYEEYLEILTNDPSALDEIYHDLLIGVTEFYRDPDAIRTLREQVIDVLARETDGDRPLRIWVPACASGEEAYTLAIEFSEALIAAGSSRKFRIIATDVHRESLERASSGIYPEDLLAKIPEPLRLRYFERRRSGFGVVQTLRQKVIFSVHDVLSDPPFMNLDLISCRNLFIYLRDEPQARVISMFLFALRQDRYLFLGPSESLGKFNTEFRVIDSRWRLFQKISEKRFLDRAVLSQRFRASVNQDMHPQPDDFLRSSPRALPQSTEINDLRKRDTLMKAYDALLKRYVPSSILVTGDGIVLSWFGSASAFIDTMNNLADWTVEDIVHADLHFVINVAMEKLRQGQLDSYSRKVTLDMGQGRIQPVTVRIEALDQRSPTRLMLVQIALDDASDPVDHDPLPGTDLGNSNDDMNLMTRRIQELERDLRLTEETLQHVTERLEASGEELQASNEELQASNEELQASNEELQSSNEELHAVNEELISVSAEHERKIELLSELNSSTEQMLRLLHTGAIFLDAKGRIRRFSELIAEWFRLESHDVDRSFDVVGPRLEFVDLARMVHEVLETRTHIKVEGLSDGRRLRVEAHPLGGTEDTPEEGVLLAIVARPDTAH